MYKIIISLLPQNLKSCSQQWGCSIFLCQNSTSWLSPC